MLTPDQALQKILSAAPVPSVEEAPLADAVGRVLSEDLFAREDLPSFTNSAMDGFAVRHADVKGASPQKPVSLAVRATVQAGEFPEKHLTSGEAVRIMTGAPVPPGADAVVMREKADEKESARVLIATPPEPGDCIRLQGEDIRRGEKLLSRGARLRPIEVALLAAQGFEAVPVARRPAAALIVTGDEILRPGEPPRPGKIHDANGPALAAALSRWGIDVVFRALVGDDPESLRGALREGLSRADVLLLSGGVSMGDFDFTRPALEGLGVKEIFWRVAIKPGSPLLFALSPDHKMVFGLPGNPLSALLCLEEFVRPALEKMQGLETSVPTYDLRGTAVNAFAKPLLKQQYLFCRASPGSDGFSLRILQPQGSAMVGRVSGANALALAPVGLGAINPGDVLSFRWLE